MCDCLRRRVKSFSFTTNHKAMGENFKFSIIFTVFFLLKGLRERYYTVKVGVTGTVVSDASEED